jgi:membrane AbrB-like protein
MGSVYGAAAPESMRPSTSPLRVAARRLRCFKASFPDKGAARLMTQSRTPEISSGSGSRWTSGPTGQGVTLAVAAAGGLAFQALHVPGGAMSGSVLSVALISYFGGATPLGNLLRLTAMAITGTSIGSALEPATFRNIGNYPASILLMTLCVIMVTFSSMVVSNKISRWPKPTALLAAVPGSMAYILSVSLSLGADPPRVVIVQMIRVIFLVVLLPLIIALESDAHITAVVGLVVDPPLVLLGVSIVSVAVGLVFTRLKMGGGMIFGSMLASGFIHGTGLATGRVPFEITLVGQVMIGAWAGSRFAGFDWALFGRTIVASTLAIGTSLGVSFAFATFASKFLGMPFGATLIAYAPGGLEAMVVLALGLGIDPLFVSAHHFSRYILINLSLPFLIRYLMRREGKAPLA